MNITRKKLAFYVKHKTMVFTGKLTYLSITLNNFTTFTAIHSQVRNVEF